MLDDEKKKELESFFLGMEAQEQVFLSKCNGENKKLPYFEEMIGKEDIIYSYLCVLGNGDFEKGLQFIMNLSTYVNVARVKHPPKEWKTNDEKPVKWLFDEVAELNEEFSMIKHAMPPEMLEQKLKRIKEETLDVMTVALRIFNREWE